MQEKRKDIESLSIMHRKMPLFDPFVDRSMKAILKNDPNAPTYLYTYYLHRFNRLRHHYLFPNPIPDDMPSTSMPGVDDPEPVLPTIPQHTNKTLSDVERRWIQLRDELRYISEFIWRQFFTKAEFNDAVLRKLRQHRRVAADAMDVRDTLVRTLSIDLEFYTYQSRSFLLLWLEVELYFFRAISNYQFYDHYIHREGTMTRRFHQKIEEYTQLRRDWDRQLGISLFYAQEGDAERLKALSKEFGPARLGNEEPGWITEASAIREELRYIYFDELLREQRKLRRWGSAIWLTSLKWTLGFGVKPIRFLFSTLSIIAFFTIALTTNDVISAKVRNEPTCLPGGSLDQSLNPYNWLTILLTHIRISLFNLIGKSGNESSCGWAGVFTTLEVVISYFFLATLAALFIEQLVDVER
jgi:hypothetical protein